MQTRIMSDVNGMGHEHLDDGFDERLVFSVYYPFSNVPYHIIIFFPRYYLT